MYSELIARSNYSFLRGASHPEEMAEQAAALGLHALGLADLNGVYGLPKAYWKARSLPSLKLVYGAELTLEGGPPLVLHAQTKAAWGLLCRLISASHADKPKGEAGLGWLDFLAQMQAAPAAQELLCLPLEPALFGAQGTALDEGCYPALKDLFGDSLHLPLPRFLDGRDAQRTGDARSLSRRYGLPVVATNLPHYHVPERRRLQDALASVREGVTLGAAGHRLFPNGERYLKSPAEMAALFSDWPEALRASLDASERCGFSLSELRYQYPSEWIPAGATAQGYLEELTRVGSLERYKGPPPPEVEAQLAHELGLIRQLGFADYFLTIHEMVAYARGVGILCQGRGSAANSAVCYCLGITAIDPVKMDLLFERFISEERAEPPDIDVDFEHERREEVIQHLYTRYGRHRAAMVSAVITYRSRSAIADLSKALGRPLRVGRRSREVDLGAEGGPHLEDLVQELKGFPRHLSIHSGGFVLSGEPLTDLVPIEPARMAGRTVIQWDKYDLDYLGLMKVDVLALGMLSALRRCMDMVGYKDLAELPPDDPGTYAMIQAGDTVGVFQIESRAQMSMLGRLKPATFYDLVIEVAIVRPGPIVGQMVHPYLRRRQGKEAVSYDHPMLERILGRTLGVPLFQEQVMKIAVELGGFSPGESDELRRAIGAWRSDGRLDGIALRLRSGLLASGLSPAFCDRLFEEIKGFAEYGFPESHAASFALLAYASSYLKHKHPAEFTAAMINSQPMGFYANHTLVDEAKRHGVTVRAVDLNASRWDCHVIGAQVQLGFRVVGGLAKAAGERLMAQRGQRPFDSLEDTVRRGGLPLRVLQALALGDAFAPWGWSQREALWRLLELQMLSGGPRQGDLFGLLQPADSRLGGFGSLGPWAAVQKDYQAYGLSVRAHPMQSLRAWSKEKGQAFGWTAAQARALPTGSKGWAAGLAIVRQHPGTAKGVVFVTLEDETGFLDLVLWKDIYERYRQDALQEPFLRVWGELQRDGEAQSFLVQKIQALPLPDKERVLDYRTHDWR